MSIDVFSSHMHADRVTLEPARAAVVVVDMVNDFCKPGGKMVLPGCDSAGASAAGGHRRGPRRPARRSSGCMTATGAG